MDGEITSFAFFTNACQKQEKGVTKSEVSDDSAPQSEQEQSKQGKENAVRSVCSHLQWKFYFVLALKHHCVILVLWNC